MEVTNHLLTGMILQVGGVPLDSHDIGNIMQVGETGRHQLKLTNHLVKCLKTWEVHTSTVGGIPKNILPFNRSNMKLNKNSQPKKKIPKLNKIDIKWFYLLEKYKDMTQRVINLRTSNRPLERTPNPLSQQFMKEFLSFGGFGRLGYAKQGYVGFPLE